MPPIARTSARAMAATVLGATVGVLGCRTPPASGVSTVSAKLTDRFAQSVSDAKTLGQVCLPPGVTLDGGLTEDAAISVALWNNPAFQELLVDLGLARADLIQAGLLPNPEFVYYFGATDKPFKYLFDFPIDALWLRPIRVKAAARDADRASDRLTQAGLDLIRDVRVAYADVVLARDRQRVANEALKLRGDIAAFATKRLDAGAIAAQEQATAKIDALIAAQETVRVGYDIPVAEERLRNLLGLGLLRGPLALDPSPVPGRQTLDVDRLTLDALATRPDALAAASLLQAAQARVRFNKIAWVRLLGLGDATSGRVLGHEFSPAFRVTLPLFNVGQGGVARAEAELQRAERNQQTVANQIILDVQRADLLFQQAAAEHDFVRNKVRPEVETAIRLAQAAYREGEVTYLIVLEVTRQLLDNYLREATLQGDLRRTWAELERSVGRKLPPAPAPSPAPKPAVPPPTPTGEPPPKPSEK